MNKQEALKQIEQQKEAILQMQSLAFYGYIEGVVKQLDEPQTIELPKMEFVKSQKPIVPQFVADFITEQKKLGHTLSYSIDACMSDRVAEWYWDNSELFARAWLDGYTVEKEKRYRVKMKGIEGDNSYLKYNKNLKHWYFGSLFIYNNDVDTRTYHTLKELEDAGFGWVFDCPGMEVEEVE